MVGIKRKGSVCILSSAFAVGAWSSFAHAQFTIATFADPAADATTPLFDIDLTGGLIDGGWGGLGLTLETISGDYSDVTFDLSTLSVDGAGNTSGGTVEFFDSSSVSIFMITFDSAKLNGPLGLGATEFLSLNDVMFSGSILPFVTSDESFSFAFANQVATSDGFTTTASFTSSAVPEPATLALLALGGMGFLRRRIG